MHDYEQPADGSRQRSVTLFLACVAASVLPALLLTVMFAHPGDFLRVLVAFWKGVLLGPFGECVLYGIPLRVVWLVIGLTCLPLMFAHPVRSSGGSVLLTLAGFFVWYAAAFVTIVNYETPL
jgi:hypothetical protein